LARQHPHKAAHTLAMPHRNQGTVIAKTEYALLTMAAPDALLHLGHEKAGLLMCDLSTGRQSPLLPMPRRLRAIAHRIDGGIAGMQAGIDDHLIDAVGFQTQ